MGWFWNLVIEWPSSVIGQLMRAGWAVFALIAAGWCAVKFYEFVGAHEKSPELRLPDWKRRVYTVVAVAVFIWLALVLYRAEFHYAVATLNPRDEYY